MRSEEQPKQPAFEQVCQQLGVSSLEEMKLSVELKSWVTRNYLTKYVPEALITEFGLPMPEGI